MFSWKEGKMLQTMTRAIRDCPKPWTWDAPRPGEGNPRLAGSLRHGGDKIPTGPVDAEVLNRGLCKMPVAELRQGRFLGTGL